MKAVAAIDETLYPWCTTLRAIKCADSPLQSLLASTRGVGLLQLEGIDIERLAAVSDAELISRFLKLDDHILKYSLTQASSSIPAELWGCLGTFC